MFLADVPGSMMMDLGSETELPEPPGCWRESQRERRLALVPG